MFRLDVSGPGHSFEPLGLANETYGPYFGISDIDTYGETILVGSTAQIDQGDGTGAGVFRSEDDGRTWARSDAGIPDAEYAASVSFRVARSPHNPNVILTGHGPVFRSADGGQTWALAYPERTGGDALFFGAAWDPARPGAAWAYGETVQGQPYLYRSADSGASWTNHTGELTVPDGSAFYEMAFGDASTVWLAARGAVFVSHEGGFDWLRSEPMRVAVRAESRGSHCLELEPLGRPAGAVFATCGSTLFLIEAGGRAYTVADPHEGLITALHYDPVDNALYLGGESGLYRLQDPLQAPRALYEPIGQRAPHDAGSR